MTAGAEEWIRSQVEPTGAVEVVHDQPWSTVSRVPLSGGSLWFKACQPVQDFEPELTASLYSRWPDRVTEVVAYDVERAWLLLADAGVRLRELADPFEAWLEVLPLYGELQRVETPNAGVHVRRKVPDLRLGSLAARYDEALSADLPLEADERARLRLFGPRFGELCADLAAFGIPDTLQHNDLHQANMFLDRGRPRILDWGDSTISHPFFSLVTVFLMLEERYGLARSHTAYDRFRDAYLEPSGPGWNEAFELAITIGAFALPISRTRVRDGMPAAARPMFNGWLAEVFRGVIARTFDC